MTKQNRRKFFRDSLIYSASAILTPSLLKAGPLQLDQEVLTPVKGNPMVISTWNFGLKANEVAWDILKSGGRALDAVEKGIRQVEADPTNQSVGYGGLPDRDGHVTLDACIMDEFNQAGLPVISLPPSAAIQTENRKIVKWTHYPILSALENGLIPVISGDVIFDEKLGGIIFSTEDLFLGLLPEIQPDLILLAGKEPGVWKDFPRNKEIIPLINSTNLANQKSNIRSSASIDVTGGMAAKVDVMLTAVQKLPQLKISIFSGEEPLGIFNALNGKLQGTIIEK